MWSRTRRPSRRGIVRLIARLCFTAQPCFPLSTNNVREWEPLWRAKLPDVDELFEVVVDSGFVGMRKPDPEIYTLTLERLGDGLRAEDCAFLDDIEVNCETARSLGMTAIRFVDNKQAIAELDAALRRR